MMTIFPSSGDAELDRLRRLDEETSREEEKERIRDRLRRRGVPEDRIRPHQPFPMAPPPLFPPPCCPHPWTPVLPWPTPVAPPFPPPVVVGIDQVLKRIG